MITQVHLQILHPNTFFSSFESMFSAQIWTKRLFVSTLTTCTHRQTGTSLTLPAMAEYHDDILTPQLDSRVRGVSSELSLWRKKGRKFELVSVQMDGTDAEGEEGNE